MPTPVHPEGHGKCQYHTKPSGCRYRGEGVVEGLLGRRIEDGRILEWEEEEGMGSNLASTYVLDSVR